MCLGYGKHVMTVLDPSGGEPVTGTPSISLISNFTIIFKWPNLTYIRVCQQSTQGVKKIDGIPVTGSPDGCSTV